RDVAETVENALVHQDFVSGDQISLPLRVGIANVLRNGQQARDGEYRKGYGEESREDLQHQWCVLDVNRSRPGLLQRSWSSDLAAVRGMTPVARPCSAAPALPFLRTPARPRRWRAHARPRRSAAAG